MRATRFETQAVATTTTSASPPPKRKRKQRRAAVRKQLGRLLDDDLPRVELVQVLAGERKPSKEERDRLARLQRARGPAFYSDVLFVPARQVGDVDYPSRQPVGRNNSIRPVNDGCGALPAARRTPSTTAIR